MPIPTSLLRTPARACSSLLRLPPTPSAPAPARRCRCRRSYNLCPHTLSTLSARSLSPHPSPHPAFARLRPRLRPLPAHAPVHSSRCRDYCTTIRNRSLLLLIICPHLRPQVSLQTIFTTRLLHETLLSYPLYPHSLRSHPLSSESAPPAHACSRLDLIPHPQVSLQTILASRFVGGIRAEVEEWEKKLGQ